MAVGAFFLDKYYACTMDVGHFSHFLRVCFCRAQIFFLCYILNNTNKNGRRSYCIGLKNVLP